MPDGNAQGEQGELHEAERVMHALDAGGIGLWWLQLPEKRITWSSRRAQLFGLDAGRTELSHDEWRRLVHPDDLEAADSALLDAVNGPTRIYRAEYRVIWPDGSTHVLNVRGRMVSDGDGVAQGMSGVVSDVTERWRTEEALRAMAAELEDRVAERTRALTQSEARYRAYWESSTEHLFTIEVTPDDRFIVEAFNPALEAATKLTNAIVSGKPVAAFLSPEDARAVEANYRRCVAEGRSIAYEETLTVPNGQHHWETVLAPVRNAATGRITRILGSARDVTQRRQSDAKLRRMQRMDAIGQVTGGVAHDFNNLLTAILVSLEVLSDRIGHEGGNRRLIDAARQAAERGADVTRQLLAFAGRQRLDPTRLDLNEIVRGLNTLMEGALGRTIRVETTLAADLWACVGDRAQIELAVLNLALNARDAMRTGGAIRVITANALRGAPERAEEPPAGAYVALSVVDEGEGMSADVLAHAFEPFFTTKDIGSGSGLGLSQVLGLAQQLGGGVSAVSSPDMGTTVTIYIPSAEAIRSAS